MWTCKNSTCRAQSLWATLLTALFLEQLCRTDTRCSWQLELALLSFRRSLRGNTARQALHSPSALRLPSQNSAQNDADDIVFSRVQTLERPHDDDHGDDAGHALTMTCL